ncbi:hypothetical protein G6011_08029 [Alternaria panax]|uniref:Uncharacterized protein n=1 Tax=Alternaria panax TaxID=48097 RepID=A0AAD4F8W8_9PLEO|nr:hypothetical protein G6011_08029 [Alternaria panax]
MFVSTARKQNLQHPLTSEPLSYLSASSSQSDTITKSQALPRYNPTRPASNPGHPSQRASLRTTHPTHVFGSRIPAIKPPHHNASSNDTQHSHLRPKTPIGVYGLPLTQARSPVLPQFYKIAFEDAGAHHETQRSDTRSLVLPSLRIAGNVCGKR